MALRVGRHRRHEAAVGIEDSTRNRPGLPQLVQEPPRVRQTSAVPPRVVTSSSRPSGLKATDVTCTVATHRLQHGAQPASRRTARPSASPERRSPSGPRAAAVTLGRIAEGVRETVRRRVVEEQPPAATGDEESPSVRAELEDLNRARRRQCVAKPRLDQALAQHGLGARVRLELRSAQGESEAVVGARLQPEERAGLVLARGRLPGANTLAVALDERVHARRLTRSQAQ